MKKCLLLLVLAMLNFSITYSQNQGYSWTFGAAPPFNSAAAITGSAGSHTLTLLADGAAAITPATEAIGLGDCGATPIGVTTYANPTTQFGLEFTNVPTFISGVYTIEMVVRFGPTTNFHRLLGFTNVTGPNSDDGIYISPDGAGGSDNRIVFYDANVPAFAYLDDPATSDPISPNTWYHIAFVRDATKLIRVYLNGEFQGSYDDAADAFVPDPAEGDVINFFKDGDAGTPNEEVDGAIAKLSIYNRVVTESEIVNRTIENICNPAHVLPVDPREGYQWTFATAPFNSAPALAQSTGDFELTTLLGPGGTVTTGTTDDPELGTSCAVPVVAAPVAVYTTAGFQFGNLPRYVYDVYTIEMTVNITTLGVLPVRLVGFNDLSVPPASDYGIYVNTTGHIDFVTAGGSNPILAAPLTTNTWYHLVFTRDATGQISYYQNGVLIGAPFNDATDEFVTKAGPGNTISLFKDDVGDESPGELIKIGIFNVALLATDVEERFNNICNSALVVLPVSMKSFTAVKVEKEVKLTWTTATEENNLGFEVQRSKDGVNYTTIGFVKGTGTSAQEVTYSFTDIAPLTGNNYYRLKQIDINNIAKFSTIRRINMDKLQQDIHLFPNPARDIITITNIKAGDQLSIFNVHGNLIHRKVASSGQESISVDKLASGVYMLHVTDKENYKRVIRFTRF